MKQHALSNIQQRTLLCEIKDNPNRYSCKYQTQVPHLCHLPGTSGRLFIQQIFIEHLLGSRHCSRYQGYQLTKQTKLSSSWSLPHCREVREIKKYIDMRNKGFNVINAEEQKWSRKRILEVCGVDNNFEHAFEFVSSGLCSFCLCDPYQTSCRKSSVTTFSHTYL